MTTDSDIKAVVFDLGRVLINWEPEAFYDAQIGEIRRKEFFASVPIHETNLNVDRGYPFKETIYALAADYPDWSQEIRWWHDRWLEMASPLIPYSERLLRALKAKGIPVLALTNFGAETFEIAMGEYDFLSEFDQAYVSGQLKCIKPDAEIYQHLEDGSGWSGRALLFADDRPENIEAAANRGWQTHLFTTPDGWAERLVAEGLLTQDEAQ
ncbi:HAD family phosphatase [Epibacterium ulvae]|uniref:HAD family hydrolase n=1 Tax=Epibacterium ulvae TaxID=1156985 RepID=UPI001BFC2F51|nr:HAD family phosphatase [Epibacterium ulvae]MBT8153295.1 HAD family phosphatase [Epibacterium ulvae]